MRTTSEVLQEGGKKVFTLISNKLRNTSTKPSTKSKKSSIEEGYLNTKGESEENGSPTKPTTRNSIEEGVEGDDQSIKSNDTIKPSDGDNSQEEDEIKVLGQENISDIEDDKDSKSDSEAKVDISLEEEGEDSEQETEGEEKSEEEEESDPIPPPPKLKL